MRFNGCYPAPLRSAAKHIGFGMSNLLPFHLKYDSPRRGLLLTATTAKVAENLTESDPKARRSSARLSDLESVVADLTEQQCAVAGLVAGGLTNPEIAERLHLSPHTVRNYLSA